MPNTATTDAAAKSERIDDLIRDLQGRSKHEAGGEHAKRPSATKKGPGRYHAEVKSARDPKQRGAGLGFVQHEADAAKNLRRANVKALGRRQALKATKRERREALPAGLVAEAA